MFAEEFQVGREVEEVDLHAVATCSMEAGELLRNLVRRAEDMDVAADDPLVALVAAPRALVAPRHGSHQPVDCAPVLTLKDRSTDCLDLLLGLSADYMRVDDSADLAAFRPSHRMYMLGLIWKRLQRVRYGATRAGDEDQVAVTRCIGGRHRNSRRLP